MAQNSLAPGYVIFHYAVTFGTQIRPHKMTLPVLPATTYVAGEMPEFSQNDGDPVNMQAAVDGLADVIDGFFSPATAFLLAEYWQKPTESDDPLFIRSVVPDPAVGTGATAQSAGQATLSFRSEYGGIYKFTMMESEVAVTTVDLYPFPAGDAETLRLYLTGDLGWVRARDGGALISAIKLVGKTNDVLRRKYVLGS